MLSPHRTPLRGIGSSIDRPDWKPILEGAAADAAWDAIRAIARDVGEGHGTNSPPPDLAVFWAYVAGAIDEDWTSRYYDEAVAALGESLDSGYRRPGLFGGLAGAGWTLAHISDDGDGDEILDAIDAAIGGPLAVDHWAHDYDLIGGLVGLGVYFVERLGAGPAPAAGQGLTRVVDHLLATCERTGDGAAWFTAPALLPAHQRARAPDGYFNCGLAHGVPGVIALLAKVAELDLHPGAKSACEDALRWLLAQRLPADPRGRYPNSFTRGQPERQPSRTAWCYGDPGLAIAAYGAAARIGGTCEPWHELALESAARPIELCGVHDAAICHGAGGLAHIFNRLYQATGEVRFRDAAVTWFERVLAMRRPDGPGGFMAWSAPGHHGELGWEPLTNLLEGATGIALALLGAVQPTEPAWDRMFLCDLPPRSA